VAALHDLLPLIITASLACLLAAIGMQATVADLLYLWRRPRLLLKAILAVNVLVPAAAIAVTSIFPLTAIARAGIFLMAVSPAPPFVPLKALKTGGDTAYSVSLYAALAILSIGIVPGTVAILGAAYDLTFSLPISLLARNVLLSALLPLTAGIALRACFPPVARRIAGPTGNIAMLFLALAVVSLLLDAWPAMRALARNGALAAMAAVAVIAIISGHLLGGPDARHRGALAVASATRHPGIALMIAAASDVDKSVTAAILCFLLVGSFVSAPYQLWCARRLGRASS
jgi:BASS family bile acid:Na+ symporter